MRIDEIPDERGAIGERLENTFVRTFGDGAIVKAVQDDSQKRTLEVGSMDAPIRTAENEGPRQAADAIGQNITVDRARRDAGTAKPTIELREVDLMLLQQDGTEAAVTDAERARDDPDVTASAIDFDEPRQKVQPDIDGLQDEARRGRGDAELLI